MNIDNDRERVGALANIPRHRNRVGFNCKLDDPLLRERLLILAGKGVSRRGVARIEGLSRSTLKEWLDRGEAKPEIEPWGSFAKHYLASERSIEESGSVIISTEMRRLQALVENLKDISDQDRAWVSKTLAQKFPAEWGTTQNSGRELDEEPDGDGYMQSTGLAHHELADMFKFPAEELQEAMLTSANSIVEFLVDNGWRPKAELFVRIAGLKE